MSERLELALPLGGRQSTCDRTGDPIHLFGSLGTSPVDPRTWTVRDSRWSRCESGLWRVSSYGRTIIRTPANQVPLPVTSVYSKGPPPSATDRVVERAPGVWMLVEVRSSSADRRFYIDANQTFELEADAISVSWVAPPDIVDADRPAATPSRAAVQIDGILCCELARVEESNGCQEALLTQTIRIANAARQSLPIPPGAQSLLVSRDAGGAATAGDWEWTYGDFTAGTIQFGGSVPVVARRSERAPAANIYTHITSPQAFVGVEDATWTLIWTIRA